MTDSLRGPLLPPSTILQDRYRILRLHDQGGSATVYLAERVGVEDSVPLAVKELNPTAFGLAEFKNEVNVLYSLNHPNLPKVYDFFEQDGKHYLVMDFVQGVTLKERVLDHGPLSEDQALGCALQVADIFRYLHERAERKIIHRDVKPSNLMLTRYGQVKLLDFGIARTPQTRLPGNHLYAFTEDYASPEQKANRPTDERSDIYSFGVTLHFLLTGTTPGGPSTLGTPVEPSSDQTAPAVDSRSRGATGRRDPSPDTTAPVVSALERRNGMGQAAPTGQPEAVGSGKRPGLSREVRRIIAKCLRTKPSDRYASFAELARDIQGYRRAKRNRLTRVLWIAAAVVAIVAGAFVAKSILRPSLYHIVGPARVEAGTSATLEAGLPAAWNGSLDSIVWQVQDTQALGQAPSEAGRGRYLSFSSTDLGVFQVQAYLESDSRLRPLTTIQRVEVYPGLDTPSELLVGQGLTLRSYGLTSEGGRRYSFTWSVRGPVAGADAASAPVVLSDVTSEPVSPVFSLPAVGAYVAQVTATVTPAKGLEVTVAGAPVTFAGVQEVAVGQAVNGNPSFEESYGGQPIDWYLVYRSHLVYDSAVGHTGTHSLRFEPWSGSPSSYAIQLAPLEAGSLYRLTVWAKGRDLGDGSRVTIETDFRSSVNESFVLPAEQVQVDLQGTFEWKQLMLSFRIPPGDPVNLEIYLKYTGSGTLWYDDCVVEKLS